MPSVHVGGADPDIGERRLVDAIAVVIETTEDVRGLEIGICLAPEDEIVEIVAVAGAVRLLVVVAILIGAAAPVLARDLARLARGDTVLATPDARLPLEAERPGVWVAGVAAAELLAAAAELAAQLLRARAVGVTYLDGAAVVDAADEAPWHAETSIARRTAAISSARIDDRERAFWHHPRVASDGEAITRCLESAVRKVDPATGNQAK